MTEVSFISVNAYVSLTSKPANRLILEDNRKSM